MNESVESRARRAPFLWVSSAAFKMLLEDLPERQRASVGWVYMCLAAAASDSLDGTHSGFASTVSEVQAMAGMSRPTFRTAVQTLETMGLLERQNRHAANGATIGVRYILLEPDQAGTAGGGKKLAGGQETRQETYPPNARGRIQEETKEVNPLNPLEKEQAIRAGDERLRYNRRQASKLQTKMAVALLDAWNSEAGQNIKMFDGLGRPTAGMRLITGAVLAHPDVELSQWMRTMNTVLASPYPYWGKTPSPGVVFGEKVVDANLTDPTRNAGKPPLNAASISAQNLTEQQRAERRRREQEQLEKLDLG